MNLSFQDLITLQIEALRQAGGPVSVNTDDPALLGVALPDEYARCATCFYWDHETERALAFNSIDAAFADGVRKASLLERLAAWRPGS